MSSSNENHCILSGVSAPRREKIQLKVPQEIGCVLSHRTSSESTKKFPANFPWDPISLGGGLLKPEPTATKGKETPQAWLKPPGA